LPKRPPAPLDQKAKAIFSRLNADEDYLEMEISRVNLLENLNSLKKTALRIGLFGFPVIVFGLIVQTN
jgi:hypothetical protein